jgi:hypothetical protein
LTLARSRTWLALSPVFGALLFFALFFAGLRLARPQTVFYYTEGPVLGSLAGLEATGSLSGLYPADGWTEPPVVLTLYPPLYFLLSAGADRVAGTAGSFTGLRIVGVAALLGWLILFVVWAVKTRAPPAWALALLAAAFLTPGVYTLIGAAQVDVLALTLTWVGITVALSPGRGSIRPGVRSLVIAAAAFFLAIFAKQSFVAAPAALVVSLMIARRHRSAVLFACGLGAAVLAAVLLLDRSTEGGYLANTLGALGGAAGPGYLVTSLAASRPVQWIPLAVAVLVTCRGRLRMEFPEIYLGLSTVLHTLAMSKAGSSVNYFLEPTLALLLVGVIRCREAPAGSARLRDSKWRRSSAVVPGVVPGLLAVTAALAAVLESGQIRTYLASDGSMHVSQFEGFPLVDFRFIPAVLERGGRPWLNDPFAFGSLEETGRWDPARLTSDLNERKVPFVIPSVDVRTGPARGGAGTRELIHGYFWLSRPIWTALTESYTLISSGPVWVWLPREESDP